MPFAKSQVDMRSLFPDTQRGVGYGIMDEKKGSNVQLWKCRVVINRLHSRDLDSSNDGLGVQ